MLYRNNNLLLRIAQADAYAMSCEYIKHPRDDEVLRQALEFQHYVKHPTHSLKAGMYTDDTQMSIAVAEVLLADGPFTRQKFAQAFVDVFCRDPRDGYSRGFQFILDEAAKCPHPIGHFLKTVIPNSTKNGGCMRAVPIGVLKTPKEVLDIARIQASVTHNTAEGIWSAQAIALMSHFALYSEGTFADLGAFLLKEMPSIVTLVTVWPNTVKSDFKPDSIDVSHWTKWLVNNTPWNDRVTNRTFPERCYFGVAVSTVKACYTSIQNNNSLINVLKQIIDWGGDTDSVAAVAWGIASTRMTEDYSDFWENELETGRKYGVQFLKDLSQQLMDKYV